MHILKVSKMYEKRDREDWDKTFDQLKSRNYNYLL